ncbi:MAG: hypothetical protein AAF708_03980 [Deinococcota bacterium]
MHRVLSLSLKRATITLLDDLETRLNAFIAKQPVPPSLSAVVQTALEAFLDSQMWAAYEPSIPVKAFKITPFVGDLDGDTSINHDEYPA